MITATGLVSLRGWAPRLQSTALVVRWKQGLVKFVNWIGVLDHMAKVSVEAVKMTDATVSFISLVKRGANRIPFRIVKSDKQESDMIDLGKIFKTTKAEQAPAGPSVMGLVVAKSEFLGDVKEAVKKAGFSIDFVEEREDGTVIFKQSDEAVELDKLTIIKMSDDLLVVMKGFNPYDISKLPFADVVKGQGFFPAVRNATEALQSVIYDAMYSATDAAEAVTKIDAQVAEFSSYLSSLTQQLPQSVFKAEVAVAECLEACTARKTEEAAKADKVKCPECGADNAAGATKCKSCDADMKKPAAKEDNIGGGTSNEEAKKEDPAKGDAPDVAAVVKAAIDAALKPVTDMVASVQGSLTDVTKEVSAIKDGQTALAYKVAEVETTAKSAEATLKGTVIGAPPAGDDVRHIVTEKSAEDDPYTGTFDTAFITRKSAGAKRGR